jgi:hypothetical protein
MATALTYTSIYQWQAIGTSRSASKTWVCPDFR